MILPKSRRKATSSADETGAIRDVIQNHLFQVMTNLGMEPPARTDSESVRDEKVKVLKAIGSLEKKNVVRAQFNGYKKEKGVAADSLVETFAAVQLKIDSWRWKGVPFYIRAGKCLPVTCAEIVMRLRQPPTMYKGFNLASNYYRFRISPEITNAFGLNSVPPERRQRQRSRRAYREPATASGRDGCLPNQASNNSKGKPHD